MGYLVLMLVASGYICAVDDLQYDTIDSIVIEILFHHI